MLYDLAAIHDDYDRFENEEVTVRCRVRSDAMSGDQEGQKTLYEIDDPRGNLSVPTFLSFWTEDPTIPGIHRTREYVLDAIDTTTDGQPVLPRGESLLVRGTPRIATHEGDQTLFLNVTSVLIRAPDLQIGKGEMAVNGQCPRRYYLNYVKKVYTSRFPVNGNRFRGDVVHRVAERALTEHPDRFITADWTDDGVESYVQEILGEEYGIRMAQLSIAGVGLWGREDAIEIATRLFTDEEFCTRIANAEELSTERRLGDGYGYRGDVDLVLDGVPYDFKTSRSVNLESHAKQVRLYLFALLLEQADVGENLGEQLDAVPQGYIVYPNIEDTDTVQFERVELTSDDVRELLELRNDVAASRDTFGPPSPYNRDCDGCHLRTEEELVESNEQQSRDALPSACKFHCQNERRWSCYEVTDGGVVSDCTLFDECEQRLEYRDPDRVDHYNRLRKALEIEEDRRETASELIEQLDDKVLARSGRLLSGLELADFSIGHATFSPSEDRRVPAFAPGDTVILEPEVEGTVGKEVTYLETVDGEYRIQFDIQSDVMFLRDDITYRIRKTFEPETVSRKYLSYLDYAQRRGHNRRFEHEQIHDGTERSICLNAPSDVTSYLANEEVFFDLPIRHDRTNVLGEVVRSLVTEETEYPSLDEEGTVPEAGQRALILGSTPRLVGLAERALPDGPHYRMDNGGTGERTIHASDSHHEILERWAESRSLLSSVQYALETEQFHKLVEGGFGDRDHSSRFFDVLVLLGAEQLTEPEYLFLSDLADRVVAVGDTRGLGPSMVSTEATERGLDRSYFTWAHGRYASLPADNAVSLHLPGEANEFVQHLYPNDEWENTEAEFSFLDIEGDVAVDAGELEVRTSVRARQGVPSTLVFDASDTTASPFEVQSAFDSMDYLDAASLREGEVALIDELPLYLESKTELKVRDSTHHRVVIKSEATQTPEFGRSLLYNRPEAQIVSQVAGEFGAELVVTPFETHANELQNRLEQAGIEIPVVLPEQVGEQVKRAIISFGVSSEYGVLRPPLTEPEMLYRLLTCAENLLLVGHGETLRSKRDLAELVDQEAAQYSPR